MSSPHSRSLSTRLTRFITRPWKRRTSSAKARSSSSPTRAIRSSSDRLRIGGEAGSRSGATDSLTPVCYPVRRMGFHHSAEPVQLGPDPGVGVIGGQALLVLLPGQVVELQLLVDVPQVLADDRVAAGQARSALQLFARFVESAKPEVDPA